MSDHRVSDRSLDVLRVIVSDYVATREPVGSRSIVEKHGFTVSAATIRNDMAALEDADLITAPHTSSGRIPTDKGYRVFVDRLAEIRPLSGPQRRAIEEFMTGSPDPTEMLARSIRTLATLTSSVAIGHLPSLIDASIHRIEFVRLGAHRILVVLITDSGRVEQRMLDLGDDIPERTLDHLRDRFNERLVGLRLHEASDRLKDVQGIVEPEYEEVAARFATALIEQVLAHRDDRLVIAGAANLARDERDFSSILPVLEAIEEQVVLLRLFAEADLDHNEVVVSIGHEHADTPLGETSILASGYRVDGSIARVGVLGPTRMEYARNISAVRAVARYLSKAFDERGD